MLSELVRVAESDPSIGCVGPKTYYWADRQRLWSAGGIIRFSESVTRERGMRELDRGQYDRDREVPYVNGCAMLVRRRAHEETGLWDPLYYVGIEDADWCMRMKRQGYRRLLRPPRAALASGLAHPRRLQGGPHLPDRPRLGPVRAPLRLALAEADVLPVRCAGDPRGLPARTAQRQPGGGRGQAEGNPRRLARRAAAPARTGDGPASAARRSLSIVQPAGAVRRTSTVSNRRGARRPGHPAPGYSAGRSSSAASRRSTASSTAASPRPERSAIARRVCSPSERLSTQSRASWLSRPASLPPSEPYSPRLPSCGSHLGLRLTKRALGAGGRLHAGGRLAPAAARSRSLRGTGGSASRSSSSSAHPPVDGQRAGQRFGPQQLQVVGRGVVLRVAAVGGPGQRPDRQIEARRAVLALVVAVGDEVRGGERLAGLRQHQVRRRGRSGRRRGGCACSGSRPRRRGWPPPGRPGPARQPASLARQPGDRADGARDEEEPVGEPPLDAGELGGERGADGDPGEVVVGQRRVADVAGDQDLVRRRPRAAGTRRRSGAPARGWSRSPPRSRPRPATRAGAG